MVKNDYSLLTTRAPLSGLVVLDVGVIERSLADMAAGQEQTHFRQFKEWSHLSVLAIQKRIKETPSLAVNRSEATGSGLSFDQSPHEAPDGWIPEEHRLLKRTGEILRVVCQVLGVITEVTDHVPGLPFPNDMRVGDIVRKPQDLLFLLQIAISNQCPDGPSRSELAALCETISDKAGFHYSNSSPEDFRTFPDIMTLGKNITPSKASSLSTRTKSPELGK